MTMQRYKINFALSRGNTLLTQIGTIKMLQIKQKYGKNAILKGVNFMDGATGRERNRQVGGHKA